MFNLKIAFLSPFYPFRGGIAQFSDMLYYSLRKENDVNAFSYKRLYPKLLFPGKTQFVTDEDIKRDINALRTLDSINPLSWRSTAKLITADRHDLLLISYWMPFFAPALGKIAGIAKKKGVKVISILHNVIPHEKRTGDIKLTKYFFKRNYGFIILNKESQSDLLTLMPTAKYSVHPHPLYNQYGERKDKSEARKILGIEENKKVLLFFGFIRDYKGLDILINSLKNLDESYILVIAGEVYGNFEKYQKIINDNHLENRVKLFLKYISDNEVADYYSAADVCILPYKGGTQSGVTSLAFNFDLPIIVTDVGGLKEMAEDYNTGLVVKEPITELLTHSIRKYFDEKLQVKFENNIKKFKDKFTWDNLANEIIELYYNI